MPPPPPTWAICIPRGAAGPSVSSPLTNALMVNTMERIQPTYQSAIRLVRKSDHGVDEHCKRARCEVDSERTFGSFASIHFKRDVDFLLLLFFSERGANC